MGVRVARGEDPQQIADAKFTLVYFRLFLNSARGDPPAVEVLFVVARKKFGHQLPKQQAHRLGANRRSHLLKGT